MRYVALVLVCVAFGFLIGRYLIPPLLDNGVLFSLAIIVIVVAAVLVARAYLRRRSGS